MVKCSSASDLFLLFQYDTIPKLRILASGLTSIGLQIFLKS